MAGEIVNSLSAKNYSTPVYVSERSFWPGSENVMLSHVVSTIVEPSVVSDPSVVVDPSVSLLSSVFPVSVFVSVDVSVFVYSSC